MGLMNHLLQSPEALQGFGCPLPGFARWGCLEVDLVLRDRVARKTFALVSEREISSRRKHRGIGGKGPSEIDDRRIEIAASQLDQAHI